jgi:hypothetical protein
MHTFLLSEPKAVLVYFPSEEEIVELNKIRKMDNQLPIAVVLNNLPPEAIDLFKDKSTKVLAQDEVSDYLDKL